MSALALLNHLLNFVAPAVFIALLLAAAGRLLFGRRAGATGFWTQIAVNAAAGVLVLAAGLALFGSDGRMATYAALAVVCGTVQWMLLRGWRR